MILNILAVTLLAVNVILAILWHKRMTKESESIRRASEKVSRCQIKETVKAKPSKSRREKKEVSVILSAQEIEDAVIKSVAPYPNILHTHHLLQLGFGTTLEMAAKYGNGILGKNSVAPIHGVTMKKEELINEAVRQMRKGKPRIKFSLAGWFNVPLEIRQQIYKKMYHCPPFATQPLLLKLGYFPSSNWADYRAQCKKLEPYMALTVGPKMRRRFFLTSICRRLMKPYV